MAACAVQQGAAAFVETLTTRSLKVDQDELIAHMLAAGAMTDAELAMMQQVRRGAAMAWRTAWHGACARSREGAQPSVGWGHLKAGLMHGASEVPPLRQVLEVLCSLPRTDTRILLSPLCMVCCGVLSALAIIANDRLLTLASIRRVVV